MRPGPQVVHLELDVSARGGLAEQRDAERGEVVREDCDDVDAHPAHLRFPLAHFPLASFPLGSFRAVQFRAGPAGPGSRAASSSSPGGGSMTSRPAATSTSGTIAATNGTSSSLRGAPRAGPLAASAGPRPAGPVGAGPVGAGPVGAGPVGAGPVGAGPDPDGPDPAELGCDPAGSGSMTSRSCPKCRTSVTRPTGWPVVVTTASPISSASWNSSGSPDGPASAESRVSQVPRSSSAWFRSVTPANWIRSRPECQRSESTVSGPGADGPVRSTRPTAKRRSGSSVRTSTDTSPWTPCGRVIRPTTSCMTG